MLTSDKSFFSRKTAAKELGISMRHFDRFTETEPRFSAFMIGRVHFWTSVQVAAMKRFREKARAA